LTSTVGAACGKLSKTNLGHTHKPKSPSRRSERKGRHDDH